MQRPIVVLLQQAVYDLGAHIVGVLAEDAANSELLGTCRNVVFIVEIAVPAGRDQVKP